MSIILIMSPRCARRLGAAACDKNSGAFRLLPTRSSHCGSVIRPIGVAIKTRGVIDQNVQAAEFEQGRRDQFLRRVGAQKMRGKDGGRVLAHAVEFVRQGNGGCGRRAVVNENIGAGRVQRARDLGADAARAAGDQHDLIAQGKIVIHDDHAPQRYRNRCGGAK